MIVEIIQMVITFCIASKKFFPSSCAKSVEIMQVFYCFYRIEPVISWSVLTFFLVSYFVSLNMKGLVEYLTGEEKVLERLGKSVSS